MDVDISVTRVATGVVDGRSCDRAHYATPTHSLSSPGIITIWNLSENCKEFEIQGRRLQLEMESFHVPRPLQHTAKRSIQSSLILVMVAVCVCVCVW